MDLWPRVRLGAEVSSRRERIELLTRIEHGEFEVCQPIERERRGWFGRSKRVLIHRTEDDRWDVQVV